MCYSTPYYYLVHGPAIRIEKQALGYYLLLNGCNQMLICGLSVARASRGKAKQDSVTAGRHLITKSILQPRKYYQVTAKHHHPSTIHGYSHLPAEVAQLTHQAS
jgi:hypothetical protein